MPGLFSISPFHRKYCVYALSGWSFPRQIITGSLWRYSNLDCCYRNHRFPHRSRLLNLHHHNHSIQFLASPYLAPPSFSPNRPAKFLLAISNKNQWATSSLLYDHHSSCPATQQINLEILQTMHWRLLQLSFRSLMIFSLNFEIMHFLFDYGFWCGSYFCRYRPSIFSVDLYSHFFLLDYEKLSFLNLIGWNVSFSSTSYWISHVLRLLIFSFCRWVSFFCLFAYILLHFDLLGCHLQNWSPINQISISIMQSSAPLILCWSSWTTCSWASTPVLRDANATEISYRSADSSLSHQRITLLNCLYLNSSMKSQFTICLFLYFPTAFSFSAGFYPSPHFESVGLFCDHIGVISLACPFNRFYRRRRSQSYWSYSSCCSLWSEIGCSEISEN